MVFEVGQYYMGYINPENVYEHEQKFNKSEWTVFVRTKDTKFRPMTSQFVNFIDFEIPKRLKPLIVDAPE